MPERYPWELKLEYGRLAKELQSHLESETKQVIVDQYFSRFTRGKLYINDLEISLPSESWEEYICECLYRVEKEVDQLVTTVFSKSHILANKKNESDIYTRYTYKKQAAKVQDAARRINKKIRLRISEAPDLFSWKSRNIRRNY